MCGIFFCLKKNTDGTKDVQFDSEEVKIINKAFDLLNKRGPDSSNLKIQYNKIFGFKRLAINDLSENGNQPFIYPIDKEFDEDNYTHISMCNGEIYNHKDLEQKYKIVTKSNSDCECLIPLYKSFFTKKLDKMFNEIDGVFAMTIYDKEKNMIIIARDKIGVKPLFYINNDDYFIISSEAKTLDYIKTYHPFIKNTKCNIVSFPPRSFGLYFLNNNKFTLHEYYNLNNLLIPQSFHNSMFNTNMIHNTKQVHDLLYKSVEKRLLSDRPIGCLLSGGVDSSIIAAILAKIYNTKGKKIKTFSVGFPDSTDLKYARIVADYIKSDHNEYIIDYKDAINIIPDVINAIETYDITTIRASVPMYLLCKYIKENFKETVIFSGEGSDELFGGYLYFHYAPDNHEFHRETIRLVSNLHIYDVLRADRCISGNSLEIREPFLDKDLIEFVGSLDGKFKKPRQNFEKFLLRKAFNGYLPDSVLWRQKVAFSDGVGNSSVKPWYKYLQEHADTIITDNELQNANSLQNKRFNKESLFYYQLFTQIFKSYDLSISYWLPKWIDTGLEPSATVLDVCKNS